MSKNKTTNKITKNPLTATGIRAKRIQYQNINLSRMRKEKAYVLSALHWLVSCCFHGNPCTVQDIFLSYPTLSPHYIAKNNSKISKQAYLVNAIDTAVIKLWMIILIVEQLQSILYPQTLANQQRNIIFLSYSWEKCCLTR